jgi:hypothetical protein
MYRALLLAVLSSLGLTCAVEAQVASVELGTIQPNHFIQCQRDHIPDRVIDERHEAPVPFQKSSQNPNTGTFERTTQLDNYGRGCRAVSQATVTLRKAGNVVTTTFQYNGVVAGTSAETAKGGYGYFAPVWNSVVTLPNPSNGTHWQVSMIATQSDVRLQGTDTPEILQSAQGAAQGCTAALVPQGSGAPVDFGPFATNGSANGKTAPVAANTYYLAVACHGALGGSFGEPPGTFHEGRRTMTVTADFRTVP